MDNICTPRMSTERDMYFWNWGQFGYKSWEADAHMKKMTNYE